MTGWKRWSAAAKLAAHKLRQGGLDSRREFSPSVKTGVLLSIPPLDLTSNIRLVDAATVLRSVPAGMSRIRRRHKLHL